jgi:hypothetical protein
LVATLQATVVDATRARHFTAKPRAALHFTAAVDPGSPRRCLHASGPRSPNAHTLPACAVTAAIPRHDAAPIEPRPQSLLTQRRALCSAKKSRKRPRCHRPCSPLCFLMACLGGGEVKRTGRRVAALGFDTPPMSHTGASEKSPAQQ